MLTLAYEIANLLDARDENIPLDEEGFPTEEGLLSILKIYVPFMLDIDSRFIEELGIKMDNLYYLDIDPEVSMERLLSDDTREGVDAHEKIRVQQIAQRLYMLMVKSGSKDANWRGINLIRSFDEQGLPRKAKEIAEEIVTKVMSSAMQDYD
ncbi:hypothetical protein LRY64_00185 [Candidatus Woesebacteria bacterium]|nr:hypothetical protein [Candidatus Woesebacteria bacterium]